MRVRCAVWVKRIPLQGHGLCVVLTESRCVPLAWALCGCYVGPFMSVLGLCWLMLAFPGLPWRHVQPVTQRKPNSARNCPIEAPAPNPHVIDFVAAGAGAGVPSGSCRFGPAKRPASRVCGVMWPTWALCCVMLLTESSWANLELPRYLLVALRESGGHRAYALLPPYAPLLQRSPCLMA